jgi:N-dimethylarginine dimethylaminohydrolase
VSNLFPNGKWLLCRPVDYDVRYQINPWMNVSVIPEKQLALSQWENLHHHLIRLGAWIEYVHHEDGLPDMVFTANAGLVKGSKVVLSSFRHPERQGEEKFFRKRFESLGFTVHELSGASFEGEGDALFAGDVLIGGCGFRSDKAAYSQVGGFLGVKDVVPVTLVDPRFYHLDTCFCPLTPNLGMAFPGAFDSQSFKALEKIMEIIPIPESEAIHFVCNAVVLGTDVVLPAGCPDTYAKLALRGFTTYPVQLSEFIKAGGAAKCLTIRLDRN